MDKCPRWTGLQDSKQYVYFGTMPANLQNEKKLLKITLIHHLMGHCPYQVTPITLHWDTVPTKLRQSPFIGTLSLPSCVDHHSLAHCPYQATLITSHWDTVPTELR